MPRNGIATPGISPSNGGKPGPLLIITTAAAPWRCPKTARSTRAQVPRSVTTSLPAMLALTYSFSSQPSETPPFELRSTKTERALPDSGAPLASIAVMLLPPARAITAAGKLAVESTAATLMTPLPDAGVPVMYGAGPALPAEATTMMPALAAFCDASASEVFPVPKSEPSDMLMTSMSFCTAQSIASVTTSVEPLQPKTRTEQMSALGATPGPTLNPSSNAPPSSG